MGSSSRDRGLFSEVCAFLSGPHGHCLVRALFTYLRIALVSSASKSPSENEFLYSVFWVFWAGCPAFVLTSFSLRKSISAVGAARWLLRRSFSVLRRSFSVFDVFAISKRTCSTALRFDLLAYSLCRFDTLLCHTGSEKRVEIELTKFLKNSGSSIITARC
jgi:hypothetical protein